MPKVDSNNNSRDFMGNKVLLVDDDDIFHMVVSRAFKKSDYVRENLSLHCALDGSEALEWLKANIQKESDLPLVLLLDLNMPGMDGFQFLEKIRKENLYANLRIYVLSTSSNTTDIERCHKHDIAGYLIKSEQGNRYEKLMALIESLAKNKLN